MNSDHYFMKDLTLAEHESRIKQKAAMCLPGSLGITHKIPTIGCCTTKGMWEKLVIHLSATKIFIYIYIFLHMFLHRSLLHMSLSHYVTTACHCLDKTMRKDLSKGLKVLSGIGMMRDALISVIRAKKGNRNISRKNKKKYQHLPFTMLFQKVSEKPNPKKHQLVQELHFRIDNFSS